jgi:hypothetical protein
MSPWHNGLLQLIIRSFCREKSMGKKQASRSRVFYWDHSTTRRHTFEAKLRALLKETRIGSHLQNGDLTAVKIHFGERGATSFISATWLKPILDFLRKCGARPFLTDTNTLYAGSRGNGVSHALLAREHGFDPAVLQAPVVIADGIRGTNQTQVSFQGEHFQVCHLAGDITAADALLNCSHFTGHHLCGFAGALKNLAMGCASPRGKMQQHSTTGPVVQSGKCIGCGACREICPAGALIREENLTVAVNRDRCTGCALCLLSCPANALSPNWDTLGRDFQEKMGEYAAAVLSVFKSPVLHLNFLLGVTPGCDCEGRSDPPICPDLGILASYDPVALDQASLDLVNSSAESHPGSSEKEKALFPGIPPGTQGDHLLRYAEKLGIGSRDHTVVYL